MSKKGKVSVADCERMRDLAIRGWTINDLTDRFDVSSQIIRLHALGECTCDTAISPAEDIDTDGYVDPRDCEQFRMTVAMGVHPANLADEFARPTVERHAYGRCNCDVDTEPAPAPRSEIAGSTCSRWRRRANGGDGYAEIADDSVWQPETVRYHARGECSHDIDTKPFTGRKRVRPDEEMCEFMVFLYAVEECSFERVAEIIEDEYGAKPALKTVKRHVFGDCRHELSFEEDA